MSTRVFADPFSVGPSAFHQRRECSWMPARILPEGEHGGSGGAGAGAGAAGAGAADAGAAGGGAGSGHAGAGAGAQRSNGQADKGFPIDTPVGQMRPEEQANYWKYHARQHEQRVKDLGVTPEELTALREQAARAEALDYELASDKEKAVKDAQAAAVKEAQGKYVPQLVRAEFRAAIAGRVPADQAGAWIEDNVGVLDVSRFLAGDGTVDTAKVTAYVERNTTPGMGTARRGPSPAGQGYRPPGQAEPGAQGRAQAARRFGIKTDA